MFTKAGKAEWKSIDWDLVFAIGKLVLMVFAIIGLLAFASAIPNMTDQTKVVHTWEVWECDAPHGRYWTDESGSGGLTFFKSSSDLKESYTVKYLEGDVLKTLIFDSTDPNFLVHLTSNNTMTLELHKTVYKNAYGHEDLKAPNIWHLYIPAPDSLQGGR